MSNEQKIIDATSIFRDTGFIESKAYFMYYFNQVPCVSWIDQVNTDKALQYIKAEYADAIIGIYQKSKYNRKKRKSLFDSTLIVLRDHFLVELGHAYCEVFHTDKDYGTANTLIKEISYFKKKDKKKSFEINLVVRGNYGLELKSMEVKKTKLDLQLYYEDSFTEVDRIIQSRLNKRLDKGIVLLHGLPGTGKTTYLRYLIGKLRKKVLFLSPAVAGNLLNPDFMDLLIDNPDSVLIIEDAETVIMDRKVSQDSSVSNLLNISDGLLADFLNVQVICTFNQSLALIDNALMRKGRLIAKYEFGLLGVKKAQQLSKHFGFDSIITKPMTIAEIANQHEKDYKTNHVEVIGFRRELAEY